MQYSGSKQLHRRSSQTSALSSIHSRDSDPSKARRTETKRNSQISILQKLNSSHFKDIQIFDTPSNIMLPTHPQSNYFVLSQQKNPQIHKMKSHNQPYKYNEADDKMVTFSPIHLKKTNTQSSGRLKTSTKHKENALNKTPSRRRFLNPTQSWVQKITPQKPTEKSHNHTKNIYQRQPLTRLSIHEQLYLESRKKQIKRSAEQIIENQYFKKVHPFKPEVSQVSQFLAEQKRLKLKARETFEREFQVFNQQQGEASDNGSKHKKETNAKKDLKSENMKQNNQKQAELKNYNLLKHFFFYLSQNQPVLSYSNLTPKILCELPSACINLLQPLLQQFYKNKKTKKVSWLQFLSEFNLKIQKRKSFYPLIEKWFWIKYKLRFDSNCKASFEEVNFNKNDNNQDSTYVGQDTFDQESKIKTTKPKKIY